MRAVILAALAATIATPALAQVKADDIGPNGDRDFWCAAAYGMYAYTLGQTGDKAGADAATENMQVLFSGISIAMQAKGMKREDFDGLVSSYTATTMNPFLEASYTQETCDAAVKEVRATLPAEPPATEGSPGPGTPDAAPAPGTAPAPDAAPSPAQ